MRRTMMTLRRGFHPPRRSDDGRAPPPSTRTHESSSANTCAEDVPTHHEYSTSSPKTTPRKRRRDDANDHVHVEVRHKASSSASDAEQTPQRTPTRVVSYPQNNNNNNNVVRSPRQTAADLFRRNHSLAEATTPPRPSNASPPAPTKGVAPNGVLADLHQQYSSSQPDERTAAGSSPSSSTSNVFVTAMEQMLRESSSLFASQTSMMHVEARTPQKEEDDDHDHDHHPEKSSAPVPVGLESEKMDVDEADADLDRELAEELRMSMDIGFTPSIGTHIPNYSQRSTTSDAEEEHNTNNVSMAQWMMTEENPMEKHVQGPNINNKNFCGEKHGHQLGQAAEDVPSVAAGSRTRFLFTSAPPPHEPSSPHVMETNTHEAATHTSVSPSRMDDQVEVARPKRTCFAFNGITTHTTSPPTPSYTSCAVGGLQMNEVASVATSSEPVTEVPPPTTHEEHTNTNINSTYNLPPDVFAHYCRVRRVERLYAWQHDVLTRQDLINGHSLVYSLPTSGGKTLVAEVCLLRCVMNVKKSAILVLPFVSLAEEKAAQLRPLGEAFGFGVEAHYGSVGRTPLAASPCIFVCTIEKANSVMNHLLGEEDGRRAREELGLIVVDELHMLGEPKRGATLELLLSKVLLVSDAMKKERKHHLDLVADEESDDKVMPCVQILGMSATIPNLPAIATWLGASSYAADFRPVPLHEYAVVKGAVLRDGEVEERRLRASTEAGALMELATEVADGSVLIFCASRQQCVDTARSIARHISTSSPSSSSSSTTTQRTDPPGLRAMLSDLLSISHFEATQLAELLPHGVAFHHGGLLAEERELVEQAYRAKRVRILCCTSTLAAGVNLPSRRVIFRSPYVGRDFLTRSRYQQMCGRAGRAGYDEYGESFLLLPSHRDEVRGMQLMHQPLERCCSNITEERSGFARALLECVSVGLVRTREDAHEWGRRLLVRHALGPVERSSHASTALIREDEASEGEPDGTITPTTRSNNTEEECAMMILKSYVEESLHTLLGSALLTVVVEPAHEDDEADAQQRATPSSSPRLVSTPFGASAVRSCFTVEEAVMVREELDQLQRGGLILCDDLHLCYYLVPLREVGECDWMLYRTVLSRLSSDRQRIADLIGVDEHYIDQRAMGLGQPQQRAPPASSDSRRRLFIARRFFVALMLADLLAEVPMPVVEQRYNVSRGQLQSLMRSASIFSSSITAFCSAMEWFSLESVLTTFVRRLGFGVKPDVLPLMEIAGMQASRARALWNAGFKKPALIATVDADELVRRVRSANPPDCKSAKFLNRRAAMMIIRESNRLLQSQIQEKKVELQELTVHRMLSS